MVGRLAGKAALVVGAGSIGPGWGNGRATAVLFAREGANVFAVDVDDAAVAATVAAIAAAGGAATAHRADVTDPAQVAAMVEAGRAALGRIDVLVNNVGGSAPGDVVAMSEEVWARQLELNLTYVFRTMKHVIPLMRAQGGGSIVNLASIAAVAHYGPSVAAYAASKAGLIHLTRVTAVDHAAANVRCNIIVPGLMDTPLVTARLGYQADGDLEALLRRRHAQVPMGRMGDAWDVAYAALYLASEESRYVTGAVLAVDGGLSATSRHAPS